MSAKELLNETARDLQRNDDDIGQDVPVKPPVGVVPRYIRDIERLEELCRGIHHYINHKQEPNREWLEELHELLSRYLDHLHYVERHEKIGG